MRLYLCAIDHKLYEAWKLAFVSCSGDVQPFYGDCLTLEADAIVSPANSYGFMDGGFDYILTQRFGLEVQEQLQRDIQEHFNGELLVGQAHIVFTDDPRIKSIICAPTMRVPMILGPYTVNPYMAARAAFQIAKLYDAKSMIMTGLGTGVGQVPYHLCATQVRQAYDDVFVGQTYPTSWRDAQLRHMKLYTHSIHDLQRST